MLLNATADKLVIKDWYLGSQYHVEEFRFTDGATLLDSQVQGLITAMAQFGAVSALAAAETGSLTKQAHDSSMISNLAASAWR